MSVVLAVIVTALIYQIFDIRDNHRDFKRRLETAPENLINELSNRQYTLYFINICSSLLMVPVFLLLNGEWIESSFNFLYLPPLILLGIGIAHYALMFIVTVAKVVAFKLKRSGSDSDE